MKKAKAWAAKWPSGGGDKMKHWPKGGKEDWLP